MNSELRPPRATLLSLIPLLLCVLAPPARAATLRPGALVVIDTNAKRIVAVDPASGDRETITDWKLRTGRTLSFPWDVVVDVDQRILVGDMNARAIFAIDAATGEKTIVSGRGVGAGPEYKAPRGIALDGAGGAYVCDTRRAGKQWFHRIFHVDLATGDRRVLSGEGVGRGPRLEFPADLVIEAGGALLVNQRAIASVFRIDPQTGDRSVVSGPEVGSGPALANPFGMALLTGGDVVVTDRKRAEVVRIDTRSGDRTLIASSKVGSGPALKAPFGVAQAPDGNLYVVDLGTWSIYRVDLASGERSVLASKDVGGGEPLRLPRNLALVPSEPTPPASAIALIAAGLVLAIGVVLLLFARPRRAAGAPTQEERPEDPA